MSIYVMTLIRKYARGLTMQERLVVLSYADRSNDDGENTHPRQDTLGDENELSARSVQHAIKGLRDKGWLVLTEGASRGRPPTYRVVIEKLLAVAAEKGTPERVPLPRTLSGGRVRAEAEKGTTAEPERVRDPDSAYKDQLSRSGTSGDPSRQQQLGLLDSGQALTAEGVVLLWNANTSEPVPKLRDLSPGRRRKLEPVLARYKRVEDWVLVLRYLMAQPWATGRTERRFVMDLDMLLRERGDRFGKYLEHARAGAPRARTQQEVKQGIREANTRAVAADAMFTPAMEEED